MKKSATFIPITLLCFFADCAVRRQEPARPATNLSSQAAILANAANEAIMEADCTAVNRCNAVPTYTIGKLVAGVKPNALLWTGGTDLSSAVFSLVWVTDAMDTSAHAQPINLRVAHFSLPILKVLAKFKRKPTKV